MSIWACPDCGYHYNEATGDAREGYPPCTPFDNLPADFVCPDCYVRAKDDFVKQSD